MHKEKWKLNPIAPLIHPCYNNYPKAHYTNQLIILTMFIFLLDKRLKSSNYLQNDKKKK